VSNSLTSRKDEFIPAEGKQVKWYICGPTVYDSSHLGHARTYLSFDIIRRILEDYFGYDVQVCMNITDIDDKIIIRARKNHLFEEYLSKVKKSSALEEVDRQLFVAAVAEHVDALEKKAAKLEAEIKSGKRNAQEAEPELNLAKEKLNAGLDLQKRLGAAVSGLTTGAAAVQWVEEMKDAISDYLDVRHGKELPHEVLNKISKDHAMAFEAEYLSDMKSLGIKTPDALTRVTEYVPEVVAMCERIIANGYAYESEGSVYFDVAAFDKAQNHFYAKLVPSAYGNTELLEEGEGGLSTTASKSEKRSPNDFALWKNSKAGEPVWPSPWGLGRPGWHIECSAMAGNVLGATLDIHAGGCDLRFPHHDNELAQSEAFFDNAQWVNYFLHTGHLHIDGLKMSKSLKNFITIREMLAQHSARHVRFLFLLQSWDNNMNFQRIDTMKEVVAKEKYFNEFFLRVEQVIGERTMSGGTLIEHWNEKDTELGAFITQSQNGVHKALSDNFDTAAAMKWLSDLVTKANSYMEKNGEKKAFLLKKAATFITRILRVFGIVDGNQEFGFDNAFSSASNASSASPDAIVQPYLTAIANFTNEVTALAKDPKVNGAALNSATTALNEQVLPKLQAKLAQTTLTSSRDIVRPFVAALVEYRKQVRAIAKEAAKDGVALLKLTDSIRDEIMPQLDVRIADDGEFSYLFQSREELEKERLDRLAAEASNRRAKLVGTLQRKEKDLEKWKEASESPSDAVHRQFAVRIAAADAELPEADENGKKLSKSAAKDIKKLWTKQDTAHKKFQQELAANADFLAQLEAEVNSLKAQLAA
jgi:cysteinyl-tRNA synthetase